MKQTTTKWMPAAILTVCGMILLSGCTHDMDDYEPKAYSTTDADRQKYAEEALGVKIDPQQDWTLTKQYSVKITADADLERISEIAVLDDDPYAGSTYRLARAAVSSGGSVTLTFRAPIDAEVLYAACYNTSGQCIARPFIPGTDTQVSLREVLTAESQAPAIAPGMAFAKRRATTGPLTPDAEKFYLINYPSFLRAVKNVLPEGKDNRSVIGSHDYTNTLQVRKNPYTIYGLPIAFIGGDNQTDVHLLYTWYPAGDEAYQESFLINDSYDGTAYSPKMERATKQYALDGYYLQCRQADRTVGRQFTPGDKLVLQLAKGETLMDDADQRVKVFMLDGYVFIACEDGSDWDYNDRLYWIPQGAERIEKAATVPFPPMPTEPQLWTYAWEDNTMEGDDVCDYDMNDCVIEVKEKNDDPTKLEISLVALGAVRDLWLGFENKNGQSYRDYQPVFGDKELHEVLGVSSATMVNTGNGTRTVATVTVVVDKPAGFDFLTCSFVLGAKVKKEMQGLYENDYYMLHVATAGTDPHGIIIPGKWQWPTERTCVKNAYQEFNTWASNRSKCQDWYRHPTSGKVVNR